MRWLLQHEQNGMLWVIWKLHVIMHKHAHMCKNAHAYAHAVLNPSGRVNHVVNLVDITSASKLDLPMQHT